MQKGEEEDIWPTFKLSKCSKVLLWCFSLLTLMHCSAQLHDGKQEEEGFVKSLLAGSHKRRRRMKM